MGARQSALKRKLSPLLTNICAGGKTQNVFDGFLKYVTVHLKQIRLEFEQS